MNIPTFDQLLRPILEIASSQDIMRRTTTPMLIERFDLSEEQQNARTKSGQTFIENRTGWAMSNLLKAGLIYKVEDVKFTYGITTKGRDYLESHKGAIIISDLREIKGFEEAWKARSNGDAVKTPPQNEVTQNTPDELIDEAMTEITDDLRSKLLGTLHEVNPYYFEQIVIDLLVAMGYGGSREEAAKVTQKSNDGGIDGIINEDRLGLDVIYVQAKRYQAQVGRVDVQNFVGALAGKQAHKGIFITTSGYNTNAIEFAQTVPQKVILIDGLRLADLMIEHNVGVSTERVIAIKRIDTDYFEDN